MKVTHALMGFLAISGSIASGAGFQLDNLEVQFQNAGVALDNTYSVNLGYIDVTGVDMTSYASINAAFQSVGSFAATYAGGAYAGYWSNAVNFDSATPPTDVQGMAVFAFVNNGENFSLIESNSVVFPDQAAIPNTGNAAIVDATFATDWMVHAGAYNPTPDVATPTGGGTLTLVGIPEPSIALLGTLGLLGLARRRRA